jgi:hypothetical protein
MTDTPIGGEFQERTVIRESAVPAENATSVTILPSSYEEGIANGALDIDREPYQLLIDAVEQIRIVAEQLAIVRRNIQNKKEEIEDTKEELVRLKRSIVEETQKTSFQEERIQHLTKEIFDVEHEKLDAKSDSTLLLTNVSFVPALLYFIAAVIFIGSDFAFTNNVVSTVFNLEELEGIFIAAGLAALTFLVKPATDRLVEQPYIQGQSVKRAHIFYLVVGLLGLLVLGILGFIRQQGVLAALDSDGIGEQIIEAVVTSGWGVFFFVLSSVMFAVAGAVCLSLSFPTFKQMRLRFLARRLYNALQQKYETLLERLSAEKSRQQVHIVNKAEAEAKLELLKSIPVLESELRKEQAKEDALIIERRYHTATAEKQWYNLGHDRGRRMGIRGEITLTVYQIIRMILGRMNYSSSNPKVFVSGGNGGGSSRSPRRSPVRRNDGGYLHEQLRSMIDYNFTKNQQ